MYVYTYVHIHTNSVSAAVGCRFSGNLLGILGNIHASFAGATNIVVSH